VSSELDEILALSDRVMVMNAGRVAGELPIAQCSESALGRLMGGAAPAPNEPLRMGERLPDAGRPAGPTAH